MADRMVTRAAWGYQDFVLKSGVQAERGKIACIDSADGSITKGAASATLIPLGIFVNTVLGDGVKTVTVEMWQEIGLRWWINDTVAAVVAADLGTVVFMKDDQTVSGDGTGRSPLGIVLKLDTVKGVLVYTTYAALALV